MNVQYSLTANGHDVSYLQNVIEARKKELGETSQQAATATAIQVLKSLRANTKVANPKDMNLTVKKSNQFFVGWKTKGKRRSRCVRIGSPKGQEINSKSVKDIAGLYIKGEKVTVYSVVDIVEGSKKRSEHYLILAKVEKDAMDFAKKRHINRVKRYSGMARFALTLAMMKTSGKRSSDGAKTGKLGQDVAFNNVAVYNETSGGDSGDVSIYVHDNLDYATQALKDGEQYVEIAVQKASNAIIGMINQKMKSHLTLHDPLKIPFPKE